MEAGRVGSVALQALPAAQTDTWSSVEPVESTIAPLDGSQDTKDLEAQVQANEQVPDVNDVHVEDNPPTGLSDQTNLMPFKQQMVVCVGLVCALFCAMLNQTIVSTALPTIGRVFNDASLSSWVASSYLLTSTAVQPLYGRLSDIYGRKAVLLFCMTIFLLGSILCAVSRSLIMLIICRAVAGIGGGGILTTVMIIISDIVTLEKRGKYQGFFGVILSVAGALGPLLGGIFTEKLSWRWCFYINIPLTSVAIIVVQIVLPQKPLQGNMKAKLRKVDYLGSVVIFTSVLLILIALSWGGNKFAWGSAAVLVPLIMGIVLLVVFVGVEIKFATFPLIPMNLFLNRTVVGSGGGAFLTGIVSYSTVYYLPQFYQVVRGSSPVRSGILLLPLVLLQTYSSFAAGYIVSRTGKYKPVLYFGYAIWAVASGLLSTVSPNISDAKTIGYQVIAGVGAGLTLQTSLVAIQASVQRSEMAVATGTRNFLRSIGGTIALAACSALLSNTVQSRLSGELDSQTLDLILSDPTTIRTLNLTSSQQTDALLAYTQGIRNIFYLMVACCSLSFFAVFLVQSHSLRRAGDEKLKAEARIR